MTQIERVINWIKNDWGYSIYSMNTVGDRYYGYSFYSRTKWDGMFLNDVDYLKENFKHVIDLNTMKEV